MKRSGSAALLLLIALILCISPVAAAGIAITADRTDYYFLPGENADISLKVTNTYPQAVDGSLQFTTIEQLQKTGTVMISTKNRVYDRTFTAGNSLLNVSAGTSGEPKTVRVQVAYQYTDSVPVKVTLPEITIHFVETLPGTAAQQSPVTSTSGAGSAGGLGTSSVQIVQQSVSVRQQAGQDGTTQEGLQNGQLAQDAGALREQLKREAAEQEQETLEFNERLDADPLLLAVNASLAKEGFLRESVDANPAAGDAGIFSMIYRNGEGGQVNVQGAMESGAVPSVFEQSAIPFNVTPALPANATFRSFSGFLEGAGYLRNATVANVTLSGATVNLTYLDETGKRAYVNATVTQGNVTGITLAEETAPADYLLYGVVAIIAALVAVSCRVAYRRLKSGKSAAPAGSPTLPAPPEPIDCRRESARLLAAAEEAYGGGRFADAYGLAGQAARLFISHRYGDRRERTVSEIAPVIADAGLGSTKIQALLERCTDVEFARGDTDAAEFTAMIRTIRDMIGKS